MRRREFDESPRGLARGQR